MRNNLKPCCFNGLIKPLVMITDQDKLVRGSSLAEVWFRKDVTNRDSDYENRWDASNKLQVEEDFRKRIEKRSARLHISNTNSRKLQTFREERKVWTFWGKDNPDDDDDWRYLAMASKILYPCNSLLVSILIFSTLQGNRRYYGNFSELLFGFSFFKSLLEVSGKWQVWRHVEEFGLSINFEKYMKVTLSYSRHNGSFERYSELWQQTRKPWRLLVKSTIT